jgi:hypothetical protein
VVSLLALDEGLCVGCAGVAAGVAGTLVLVQALGDVEAGGPLSVLTRGTVAAGPGEGVNSPVSAQMWGLGRVTALRYLRRWAGLVGLPPQLTGRTGQWSRGLLATAGVRLPRPVMLAAWRCSRSGTAPGLRLRRLRRHAQAPAGHTEEVLRLPTANSTCPEEQPKERLIISDWWP